MNEVYQEESAEVRKNRLRQMERDEREARAKQIEAASAPFRNVNAEYFAKEAESLAEIAANKPVALPKKTSAEIIAEHAEKYPYKPYDPNAIDPLLEREPKYVQELHGYAPVKLTPSIVLQSQPDPDVLREYNSKRPQPDMADIMNRPMSPQDQRNAELFAGPVIVRPTHPCPNCGDPITAATAFHRRADGTPCVLPGEFNEALARREGIVIAVPEKSSPSKKHK